MTRRLVVSELFGPTVQGEGPTAGRRCAFLRLGLCNLDCTWCDTPYTWDWTGKNGAPQDRDALLHMDPVDAAHDLLTMGVERVVVSGGEPLLQQTPLAATVGALGTIDVEVETNGTLVPTEALVAAVGQWNVSPKLPHSGVQDGWRSEPLAALLATGRAVFKVVCRNAGDVALTARLAAEHNVPASLVWIMPEGRTDAEIAARLPELAEAAIAHGFNLTTRLHVHAWGDKRGV